MYIYKDFSFGRYVFKHREPGAVIMVKSNNTVVAGRFFPSQMPDGVKVVFRPIWNKKSSL